MSNTITTIANGGTGNSILSGPHYGLKTTAGTITAASTFTVPHSISSSSSSGFTFTQPATPGVLTIKATADTEEAEFDAAFINDLKLLLEVIKEVPDDHPLGDLKHDMRMRRAFKKLGG